MNLIYFLLVGVIFTTILGEFGQYPFGTSNLSVSLTDLVLFITVCFFLIWKVAIKREFNIPRFVWPLYLFLLSGLIGLILSGQFSGIFYLLRFILYSSIAMIFFNLKMDLNLKFESFLKPAILSGLVLSVLGFIQLLILPDLDLLSLYGYDPHKNRLVSSFLDPNFSGVYLGLSFLCSIYFTYKDKSKFYLVSSLIILTAVILTFSRTAYLMLFMEIFLLGIMKSKKILLGLVGVTLLLYLFVSPFQSRISGAFKLDVSASERFFSWQNGLVIFQNNPIFGVGFNNIRYAQEEYNLTKVFSSDGGNSGSGIDSGFLFVAATSGILGLLFYIYFWINLLFLSFKERNDNNLKFILVFSYIGALIIAGQFINALFYPPIMVLYFSLIGVGVSDKSFKTL